MSIIPVFITLGLASMALCANILVIVPLPARSHANLFDPLVEELAKKGHQVTFVTAFQLKKPVPNVAEIVFDLPQPDDNDPPPNFFEMRHFTALHNVIILPMMISEMLPTLMDNGKFQALLKSDQKFDLIIAEAFLTEGLAAGLAHKYQAPLIGYATFMPSYWVNYWVGNEAPLSYIPDPFTSLPAKMSLPQRLWNTLFTFIANNYHQWQHLRIQDAFMRKHFGDDLPDLETMIRNTSLLFVNDHYSLSFPRPAVPNLVSIGGLHVKPPKPLDKDLKKFLDGSTKGFILFSMGSNLKSAMMGKERIDACLNAFSKLEQNVVWKFEEDLPNKPKNVFTMDWLPQSDILAHPNIKLFITHGGLLGTTESVERGVPVLGIPVFGDQPMNMRQSVNAGVGLSLDFDNLTEEEILKAINEILNNPKYTAAAKARSKAFKDVIVPPMDLALWWVEYVLRHKGAPHLRSAAQDLTWYQRYQLDVFATLFLAVFIVYKIIRATLKCLCRLVCKKKPQVSSVKKTN